MRKFLYMLAALLVLIGISTNDVEARQDVYATTYLGNSWYVDQDSVKRVGDILNFTVYTTAGLSYKVTSRLLCIISACTVVSPLHQI